MTLKLITPGSIVPIIRDDVSIDAVLPPLPPYEGAEKENACRYLFALCKRLDKGYLERLGITCMFEVTGGWLRGTSCRMVGLIVAALVIDIAARARMRPSNGVVTITLHRWGAVWTCSVADNGIYTVKPRPVRPVEIVRELTQKLNAHLVREDTKDGSTTTFVFNPNISTYAEEFI